MLGELISEAKGKRTARRVVATDPFKIEVSFEDAVKLYGVEGMQIGTYIAGPAPDGSLQGTGEGLIALSNGEMVGWRAVGAGRLAADGSVRYVGSLIFTTASKTLGKLNSMAGVFEFETSASGETKSKTWEWK